VRVLPHAEPLPDRAEREVSAEEQRDGDHQRMHPAEAAEDQADGDEADDGGIVITPATTAVATVGCAVLSGWLYTTLPEPRISGLKTTM
jgi:hypothetical protein